jgi:hypothetical protein
VNLVAGDDFGSGAESRRNAAVFFVGELDGAGNGFLGKAAAVEDMADFDAAETAGVFFAALSFHFDDVFGDLLAFLAEDIDDVGGGAASDGEEEEFHGAGAVGALAALIEGDGVAAGRDGNEEVVACVADGCFRVFHILMVSA